MAESPIGQRMLQARLDLAQRLGREVSKKEIARVLDIPAPTYGRYETGERRLPVEMLPSVAKALQTDVDYLLGIVDIPHVGTANANEKPGKGKPK